MQIIKVLIFIISFATLSFCTDTFEIQKIFDNKKPLYEKLQNDFGNYPNMMLLKNKSMKVI